MKIIAFLLVAFSLLWVATGQTAIVQGHYDVEGTQIEEVKSGGMVTLLFHTEEPFEIVLGDADRRFFINDITSYDEYFIIYGYLTDRRAETFYDAYVLFVDFEGNVVYEQVFDFGNLEETVDVFLLNGRMIIHVLENIYVNDHYETYASHFIVVEDDFESYDRVKVLGLVLRKDFLNDKVYLADTYLGAPIKALNHNLETFVPGILYGIVNHGVYEERVRLEFLGTAWLDHVAYEYDIILDYPGHYQVVYEKKTYHFTLHPVVTGVTEDMITAESVSIHISAGRAYLNHDVYVSGAHVSRPGYYTLTIEGSGGYARHYDFTITSDLKGVYDGQSYTEARTLEFKGVGYLNNRYIESGYRVNEPGIYTLTIHGENGYQEVHHFEILAENETSRSFKDTLMVIEIGLLATVFILGSAWFVKTRMKA